MKQEEQNQHNWKNTLQKKADHYQKQNWVNTQLKKRNDSKSEHSFESNNHLSITQMMADIENSKNSDQYKLWNTTADQLPVQKQSMPKQNNTGMPDQLKSGIENLSGHSMDDVKVHYNSDKPAQFQAHAFAQGSNIHIAPGQEKHLAHEAWHVVQQKEGRVKPTMQMKGGVNVNDDIGLEKEADAMGARALQMKNEGSQSFGLSNNESEKFIAQRKTHEPSNQPLQLKTNENASSSSAVVQRMGTGLSLLLAGIGSLVAHQVLTYINKKNMESDDTLVGKENPYDEGGKGKLQIRKYHAFVENEKNPFWHVWLTYKFEDGTEFKIAERGNGRENWKDYPVISETTISNNQLARILEKDDDINDKYWPSLYGPGWNDCHTWLKIVQNYAGVNSPLTTPRFNND
ncbi:eCIS core domain-containing protein [Aureibacter tunicatorum]|uniref:eCIS core domain-containing protein n=1 Tax=Aureibacter tunicatorum TaxID=866807 RepID=A0AAE3XJD7_9BACT|nr:DUF4157 domain-containing protein [Aureibacter tunicatorum]MDR6237457.1 hypothetical protein [Aureibacter tunicatorum]BDD06446.1 hypothetical protein AUTU_39290 [Aureibacter tunicatorum]